MMQRFEMQMKDGLGSMLPKQSLSRARALPLLLMCP
jgi:hypothetical protein